MGAWRLRAQVGDLVLEEQNGQEGDPPPRVVSVRWVDELEDTTRWPRIQGPSTGQLQVHLAQASDAAAWGPTTPVSLEVFTPPEATEPVATFYGRASDPIIAPHDQGVVVTLNLSDYLADLDGHTVGAANYGIHSIPVRMDRVWDAVGLLSPLDSWNDGGQADSFWPRVAARAPEPVSLLRYTQDLLSWSVEHTRFLVGGAMQHRLTMWELRPNVDPATRLLDATEPWVVTYMDPASYGYPVPGNFALVSGVYSARWDQEVVIPAGLVEFSSTWARRRSSAPNTVTVVEASGATVTTTTRDAGEPAISTVVETQLAPPLNEDTQDYARDLAMYLSGITQGYFGTFRGGAVAGGWTFPVDGEAPGWEADRFLVHVDEGPDGWWPGDLREARLVTDLPAVHNPEGSDRWPGVIVGQEVTLQDGRCVVELRLAAMPMGDSPEAATWDALAAGHTWNLTDPTVTWNQLPYVGA